MTRFLNYWTRRAAPLLGAGMLLQAGGCAMDPNAVFGGVFTSILNSLIANFVFGAFNLVGP